MSRPLLFDGGRRVQRWAPEVMRLAASGACGGGLENEKEVWDSDCSSGIWRAWVCGGCWPDSSWGAELVGSAWSRRGERMKVLLRGLASWTSRIGDGMVSMVCIWSGGVCRIASVMIYEWCRLRKRSRQCDSGSPMRRSPCATVAMEVRRSVHRRSMRREGRC